MFNIIIKYRSNVKLAIYQLSGAVRNDYNQPTIRSWLFQILIDIDRLGNALMGGDPQETISSRMGKIIREGRIKTIQYKLSYFICRILHFMDKDHCKKYINENEGDDDLGKIK